MKLKKLSYLKYKLIKIEFIKSKIYQKFLQSFDLAEMYLKKVMFIIFQYHIKNNKILFIGVNRKIVNKYKHVLKKTKHLFLPQNYWIKGLLTNKVTLFKYVKNSFSSTKIKNYILLKKSPNLIVIFNDHNQASIIKEATKLKIPVIVLNTEKFQFEGIMYHLHLNSETENYKNNNLIVLILNAIFKKKKKNV